MSTTKEQLPPCPFCGGEAIIAEPIRYVRGEAVCCFNGTQGKCALGMARFSLEQWSCRAEAASSRAGAREQLLRAWYDKFAIRDRFPCKECGRESPNAPLKTLHVIREDGQEYFGGCWLCNSADLCELTAASLASAPVESERCVTCGHSRICFDADYQACMFVVGSGPADRFCACRCDFSRPASEAAWYQEAYERMKAIALDAADWIDPRTDPHRTNSLNKSDRIYRVTKEIEAELTKDR